MMDRYICCLYLICVFLNITLTQAGSPEEWKSRTIYQLLTDRFGGGSGTCNLSDYCGGNWQGIIEHLDYIQGMGFDAIWITPVTKNYPGGYHGYWQTDFFQVNEHFGTSSDLRKLVEVCHQKGIWVMVDVVANHVGPVGNDYTSIVPFNQQSHYHDCSICPSGCSISDWNNQPQIEWCRLAGLPDLDQSNSFVNTTLVNWIKDLVSNYSFDGIRIDTVPEVEPSFWFGFTKESGVYSVGEVFNGDIGYVSSYVKPKGALDGALSYPLFFTLRSVFASQQSMNNLQSLTQAYTSTFGNSVNLLGTFIDNHDNARFLNVKNDMMLYKNAIVYTLMSTGIPIIYYGTEQGFSGGNDPNNREVLWTTNYNTESDLYKYISLVIQFRKQVQSWEYPQVQRYSTDNFYAFTRGNTFVALTNAGSNSGKVQETITFHPYANGTKLCNIFWNGDCVVVSNGSFQVTLLNGEAKIFYPANSNINIH